MIGVITADIVNSSSAASQDLWLKPLKSHLSRLGTTPSTWEFYRGDSFQVEAKDPLEVLTITIHIKAVIKAIKDLDVRMAIGLGDKTYQAERLSESNGSAFIRSGQTFEKLKKSTSLAIASGWEAFDEEINLYLKLANVIMNGWKPATAEIVKVYLNHRDLSQEALGKLIGMKQPSVSDALSRASFYELMELDAYYKKRLRQQTAQQ